jgi:hypothetical protein
MVKLSISKAVCLIMVAATFSGAQTERRGGAGPVRGLLGGKDLTGRFYLASSVTPSFTKGSKPHLRCR